MNSKFRSPPVDESPKSREKHIYTRACSQQQQRLARASLKRSPKPDDDYDVRGLRSGDISKGNCRYMLENDPKLPILWTWDR
uniref:Uncharacterized protein n=1 Tax=Trichogramma kaykai TaxID=54128 RepID=A0ABD2XIT3_9HYME